ncbi:putative P-loop containing nucleoside triphosphate hydrolase, clpA/ClpB, AAA lid [Helianthus anomalus]
MQAIEQFVYINYLTGATNGAMDAGNLLKLMLSRRELRCIGATTLDEYRKYIEKDRSLEHRFQQLYVDQPTVEDTVSILHGLHERYELHHGVRISDNALVENRLHSCLHFFLKYVHLY